MALSFRYKSVNRPDGTKVRVPSIPITLNGKEKFESVGLLDSGADISAIPKALAEILDLNLSKKIDYAYGIGGKVESIESNLNIAIEKGHEHYNFQIPVKVILGNYDFPILLGRVSIFDKFVITFDESKEKITLKRVFG